MQRPHIDVRGPHPVLVQGFNTIVLHNMPREIEVLNETRYMDHECWIVGAGLGRAYIRKDGGSLTSQHRRFDGMR